MSDSFIKTLICFGTRPEAIKLAPVIKKLSEDDRFKVTTCSTGQHKEMLSQVLDIFNILPNHELNVMTNNQSLNALCAKLIDRISPVIEEGQPDIVIVQGDTTTAMAGALAAFHHKIPVAHVEAGLRSNNRLSPFPEEVNRKIVGQIAQYHFAPTKAAYDNLRHEQAIGQIELVGNTVIDALQLCLHDIKNTPKKNYAQIYQHFDVNKKLVLVTGHRRENFGAGFQNICSAIKESAERHSNLEFAFVTHLNPNVKNMVEKSLNGISNVHLIKPVEYDELIYLMDRCHFVLTDSGGIQEEAPSLAKPVLVMRDVTERTEGIDAGTAKLVGTDAELIKKSIDELINNPQIYEKMALSNNPYGDGKTSEKIAEILANSL